MSEENPSLHIDSDWKAEAKAEKERLSEQPDTGNGAGGSGQPQQPGQLPPASLDTMIKMTAQEAIMAMGGMPDPRTGQAFMNLDVAKFHIDMLSMLEEKTKGNLSEEEQQTLSLTLHELRQIFVRQANQKRDTLRSS